MNPSGMRMSGVEFSLGAFFNRVETSLEIKKTVEGYTTTDPFYAYIQGSDGSYYDENGNNKGSNPYKIELIPDEIVKIKNLPADKFIIYEDPDTAVRPGYTLIMPVTKSADVSANATPVVKFVNKYISESHLSLGKVVAGFNNDDNLIPEGAKTATYSFHVASDSVPGYYLKADGTLTNDYDEARIDVAGGQTLDIVPLVGGKYTVTEDDVTSYTNYSMTTKYVGQSFEINENNLDQSTTVTNTFKRSDYLSIIIEKELEGVSSSNEKFYFILSYFDENNNSTVYVGADGKKLRDGFRLADRDYAVAHAIEVTAGVPVEIRSVEDENVNGIWGDKYNTAGTTYTVEEVRLA